MTFILEDAHEIFTPEDLTEQQRMIGRTASEFVTREVLPHAEHLEHEKDYDLLRGLLRQAADIGLTGMEVPEQYGGMELEKVTTVHVTESISRYGCFSNTFNVHTGLGLTPIAWFGTDAQKQRYLPKLAAAEWVSCYCLTEPQAGSDSRNSRTRAELTPDGKHYVLNGEKMWITNGGFADLFIVFGKVAGDKFTAFIVEKDFGGIRPGGEEKKMGLHGSSTTSVILDGCRVPVENVLGEVGRGHIVAFNVLNFGRLKLAAGAVGTMKQTLQHSLKYAQERTAFGKPIAEYGLIRHKLAEMAIRIYVTESMVYRTAGLIDAKIRELGDRADASRVALEEYAVECALNKVFASEALGYCVDEAVQIYGGYGFHQDYPAERAYRDARVARIFEGTNEINRLLAATMLLKRAGKDLPLDKSPNVGDLKGLFRWAAGMAAKKLEEQEVLAALTNILMEAYALESAELRAKKTGNTAQATMAEVFRHDAVRRAEGEVGVITNGCLARREIASRLLEQGRY